MAFEFRQPYVSPAIARYGQILRANDCPGDSVTNRRSTLDCRLLAVGQVVHADPMMWGLGGGAEAVAQQLYGGWFAVPQISMRLAELDDRQRTTLRWLLQLWRSQSDVTLDGRVSTRGVEHGHQLASAIRTDLDRSVIVAYAPLVVDLDHDTGGTSRTVLINAGASTGLVVRTRRPISAGTILDVRGAQIADLGPTRAGLLELAVPAYGIATLALGIALEGLRLQRLAGGTLLGRLGAALWCGGPTRITPPWSRGSRLVVRRGRRHHSRPRHRPARSRWETAGRVASKIMDARRDGLAAG